MAFKLMDGGDFLLMTGGPFVLAEDDTVDIHYIAPSWRLANAGNGTSAVIWTAPLDPNGIYYFTVDWSTELNATGDAIFTANTVLSDAAAVAGIIIHAETFDATTVTIWLKVDPALQDSPDFSTPGEVHQINSQITTERGQVFDRSVTLTVRQT